MRILILFFSLSSFLCLSQTKHDIEVSSRTYSKQAGNYQYEKALENMKNSAEKSERSKMRSLNENFELNYARKERLESKLKKLNEQKISLENKLSSSPEKNSSTFNQKLTQIATSIAEINEKLIQNEKELEALQKQYREQIINNPE